jgi:FkbM family methyltransferase
MASVYERCWTNASFMNYYCQLIKTSFMIIITMLLNIIRKLRTIYYRFRLRQLGNINSWRKIVGNIEMDIDPTDYADQAFYLGNYDPKILFFINKWVKLNDTCIDIGAQKGYITLNLAYKVGENGNIIAFEPDSRARRYLAMNCMRNKINNVRIYEYALGQEEVIRKFFLSSQLGWSTFYPNSIAEKTIISEIKLPVRSLDYLVETKEVEITQDSLSFVKIDCEGAEPFVLLGMRQVLKKSNPLLWVEINIDALRAAGSSFIDVHSILSSFGYIIFMPIYRRNIFFKSRLILERIVNLSAKTPLTFDIIAVEAGNAKDLFRTAGIIVK